MKQQERNVVPEAIRYLDLSPVKAKMLHPETESDWTEEQFSAAEQEYKKFLTLHLYYPDAVLVPTKNIDEVWHNHILNTVKYQKDCQDLFGSYMHHDPNFGLGEDDADQLTDFYNTTSELYSEHFDGDYKGSSLAVKCGICGMTKCQVNVSF